MRVSDNQGGFLVNMYSLNLMARKCHSMPISRKKSDEYVIKYINRRLETNIRDKWPTEEDVRKFLGIQYHQDVCADGAVHYITCKTEIIESTATSIEHSLEQLEETAIKFSQRGYRIEYGILLCENLTEVSRLYFRDKNKLLHKKQKRNPLYLLNNRWSVKVIYWNEV